MKSMRFWATVLVLLLVGLVLVACSDPVDSSTEAPDESDQPQAGDVLSWNAESVAEFTVIRGDTSDKEETDAAVLLRKSINEKLVGDMKISTDWVKRGETPPDDTKEFLVGVTNRAETEQAMSLLGENQYVIKMYGENRLVIVGSNPVGTKEAVDVFVATYLTGEGASFSIPKDLEIVADISYVVLEDLSRYQGGMKVEDIYGKLTVEEVKSFVGYIEANVNPDRNNIGNVMIYGKTGSTLEVLNLMYRQTGYTRMFPVMSKFADAIMAGRNDQANGAKIQYSMGGVQPGWVNTEGGNFIAVEIGDICGHVLFFAENILQTPSMWDVEVPDGDPYGYGKTYKERALTYIKLCDQTLRDYLMVYLINDDYKAFQDSALTKSGDNCVDKFHPWNRQFMMVSGFIHGSACHKLLGDDPALAAEYDKVVQTLIDFFISQLRPTTKNGKACYVWNYWPIVSGYKNSVGKVCSQTGGKIEDANDAHMAYDVYGMYKCQLYGYQNVTDEVMQTFCNTLNNVIYDPDHAAGVFRGSVNGATGKDDKDTVWPQVIHLGLYDEQTYRILFSTSQMNSGLGANVDRTGRILYVKSIRYGMTEEVQALRDK